MACCTLCLLLPTRLLLKLSGILGLVLAGTSCPAECTSSTSLVVVEKLHVCMLWTGNTVASSFMGPEFLPTVTGELGNQKLRWCSPYVWQNRSEAHLPLITLTLPRDRFKQTREHCEVLVTSVHPQKPKAVKRYALPVLWFFLGNSILPLRNGNVGAVVTKLAKSLYQFMCSRLKKHAARHFPHLAENLCEILDVNIGWLRRELQLILPSSPGAHGIISLSLVHYAFSFINSSQIAPTASQDRDCGPPGHTLGMVMRSCLQSVLTSQMKKQPSFWDGDRAGKPPYPRAISPLDGWVSKAGVQHLSGEIGDEFCHLSHRALTQDPRERELSSAALETIQMQSKLKMRRMSEGLLASQRGLTDCSDPKGLTLKPVVSRSASQRLLVPSKPLPPIQSSLPSSEPSRMSNGEQEHGEDGTGCDDTDGNIKELMSEGQGYKASRLPLDCSGENGKKSLRPALLPPIPKSARPLDGAPASTAVPLPSSQHLVLQEALEMRNACNSTGPMRCAIADVSMADSFWIVGTPTYGSQIAPTASQDRDCGPPGHTLGMIMRSCLQSVLTSQMKKQPSFWDGDRAGKPPYPRAISPLDGWVSKAGVQHLSGEIGDEFCHLSHRALTQDPRERELSSAALETIQMQSKLKMRRMSEGLLASQRGLTDCSDPKGLTLKPVVSRSASQRLLVPSKPLPPIQSSLPSSEPSRLSNGEQEHGEDGTGCDDTDGNIKELMSEGQGYKASRLPLDCSGEDGKKSLGPALLPPIPKSARPLDGAPASAAVPLPSSQHLVLQEALEMRPRSGSRSEERTLECLGLPQSQAKKMDQPVSPGLLSDDDSKDSNGRIHVTLSKSLQRKIQQKRKILMELLLREKEKEREKSLQLPTQSVDPGEAAKESFRPPPVNGTVSLSPSTSNARRESAGTALRNLVNRPSLPSIPVTSQGVSSARNSSANSLPAMALDFLEWGEEPECGDAWEARPFPRPQQELLNALTRLSSDDWQQKTKGLLSIRRLAICHSKVLLRRLRHVSLAVTKEVNNVRYKVSGFAIIALGELFRTLKKHMDQEVDEAAQVLLQKMGHSSKLIQKAADRCLEIMVGSVTPARAMHALMATGVRHRNVLVRKSAAQHLLTVMEQIGAKKLLSGTRDSTELLVRTLVKLAQDRHQDTRCCGRKMLTILMHHRKFESYLKQSVPSRDLEEVMATIKQKGTEDHKWEPPSAKDSTKSKNSGLTMPQDNSPSDGGLRSGSEVLIVPRQTDRRTSLCTVEENNQLGELCKLLRAKEFRTRMEGVVLLLDHCKSSPQLISTNIAQIFDVFVLRLRDCNQKVNQQALEVLALMMPILREALHPVLVPLVEVVTENLNSKHLGIYTAAVKVLEASIAHLDNTLLLQAFAYQVPFLSGQALLDVTEHLSVLVTSVHPQKPKAVKRYALPVLWFLLGNRVLPLQNENVRAVVTKLAKSLYQVMGSRLKKHAAMHFPHLAENLCEILDVNIG
ncbi:TOG array regulator of axonemal microtubules protein 2-like [Chlamydotis macqueenii]